MRILLSNFRFWMRITPLIMILTLIACAPTGGTSAPQDVPPTGSTSGQVTTPTEIPAVPVPVNSDVTNPPVQLGTPYDPGNPAYTDVWVDPQKGNDSADGASETSALRTLSEAWNRIPVGQPLSTGYRIRLMPGEYSENAIPVYWESRYGSFETPVLVQGQGSEAGQVILRAFVNVYDSRYLYFENLSILTPEDSFHCEKCDHLLIRNVIMNGSGNAQEVVKVNQSQHVYIESSDLSGTYENAIDFVAVQYAHVINSHIHDSGDWCMYAKGGSAYIHVAGNEIYNCGTGGFSAGQGTGFQYMVAPWLQYEAYDIKVYGNIIHDTEGAGLGVNGGYNILMAHNTLYRVGSRSHTLEVVFGLRSCDGQPGDQDRERCQQYLDAGGWGTVEVDNGENAILIGNKNVFIYNNVLYNPPGFRSEWQQFTIYAPRQNPNSSNLPLAVADDNLQIRGNIIWNGDESMPLGIEDDAGCTSSNPTCNAEQLRADNAINTIQPQFADPQNIDFTPVGDWLASFAALPIPDFDWDLPNVPTGETSNTLSGMPTRPGAR